MRYPQFRNLMAPFPVFSLNDIRMADPRFDRRRLHEWRRKGYLRLISSGYYIFAETAIDDTLLDHIANRIYAPSYVSLETVLSRYGLIPESVQRVISVSTRKTRTVESCIATFSYRSVAPRLFFGYEIATPGIRVASLEKALLDYLYLHPELKGPADYESLRVDCAELLSRLRTDMWQQMLQRFHVRALNIRATRFLEWARHA